MTDGKIPADDAVPGGSATASEPTAGAPDAKRREIVSWAWRLPVLAAVGGGAYGIVEAVRVHFFKRRPSEDPRFEERPPAHVATAAAFAAVWASVDFEVAGAPVLPGVAMRLPAPIAGGLSFVPGDGDGAIHLAAFSRICTHQHCIVSLNSDVAAINFAFNYQGQNPAITCPCHLSVFDPLRAGRAVSGPAVLPLPRVRLRLDGEAILADGIELT